MTHIIFIARDASQQVVNMILSYPHQKSLIFLALLIHLNRAHVSLMWPPG